jgi:hypothetical protein
VWLGKTFRQPFQGTAYYHINHDLVFHAIVEFLATARLKGGVLYDDALLPTNTLCVFNFRTVDVLRQVLDRKAR